MWGAHSPRSTVDCRMILIGKTGCGKSSFGNSLLGKKAFEVGTGMESKTAKCARGTAKWNGVCLEVVDTPGLCDTNPDKEEDIYREVGKSVAVAYPGPHLLVLTLRCDRRFTQEEFKAYVKLKELFSEEMSKYLFIVFNGMDNYGDTIEEQKEALKKEVSKMPGELRTVLEDASYRYVGMSNKASPLDKEKLLREAMTKFLETMKLNGNAFYKARLIRDINTDFEEFVQRTEVGKKGTHEEAVVKAKRIVISEADMEFLRRLQATVHGRALSDMEDICSLM